jgi:hypothetical protein
MQTLRQQKSCRWRRMATPPFKDSAVYLRELACASSSAAKRGQLFASVLAVTSRKPTLDFAFLSFHVPSGTP